MDDNEKTLVVEKIRLAAKNRKLQRRRSDLLSFSAVTFRATGEELYVSGHILGPDRRSNKSPFGHGSDSVVAVSLLLRIASELISSITELFEKRHVYAGAALLRQIVEIEYLAWTFEASHADSERWLRSDRKQRESFFTPAKLRAAAGERFRAKDYGYHCELGGHPVPTSYKLLTNDVEISELLGADLLGHTGRIWDHVTGWAQNDEQGESILKRAGLMSKNFAAWKSQDPLAHIPPPP